MTLCSIMKFLQTSERVSTFIPLFVMECPGNDRHPASPRDIFTPRPRERRNQTLSRDVRSLVLCKCCVRRRPRFYPSAIIPLLFTFSTSVHKLSTNTKRVILLLTTPVLRHRCQKFLCTTPRCACATRPGPSRNCYGFLGMV